MRLSRAVVLALMLVAAQAQTPTDTLPATDTSTDASTSTTFTTTTPATTPKPDPRARVVTEKGELNMYAKKMNVFAKEMNVFAEDLIFAQRFAEDAARTTEAPLAMTTVIRTLRDLTARLVTLETQRLPALENTRLPALEAFQRNVLSISCPADQFLVRINPDGTGVCAKDRYTTGSCAPGRVVTGVDAATNTVTCSQYTVQQLVSGSCPAGQSIRTIAADGSVTCEVDDDTLPSESVWQRRVSGSCPSGQMVRTVNIDGTVVCDIPSDATFQRRVSASCPAGNSIRVIAQDGTVTCEFDDLPVDTAWQRRVTGTCPTGQTVKTINIDGTVVCDIPSDTTFQRRVTATCPAGSSIRTINVDGTVVCEVDDDTIPTDTVWQRRVTATCAPGSSIRVIAVDGTVACEIDDDTIPTDNVWQRRVSGTCSTTDMAVQRVNQDGTVTCDTFVKPTIKGRTTYVHWGRTKCEFAITTIYSGWMSSGNYYHHGSGSNWLCMHPNPEYAVYNTGNQDGALLYRTEDEFSGRFMDSYLNYAHDRDMACALCETSEAHTLMVPGRVECPEGFTRQYYGWLVSNHYTHLGPNEYVCLDAWPDGLSSGSNANENGALLYPTEMEAPPVVGPGSAYLQNREVNCAMCTLQGSGRTTYVQYGRKMCSTGTTLYTGYLTGGHYNHEGSGIDYVCLAPGPDFVYGFLDADNDGALLYRTEYETSGYGIAAYAGLQNHDASCAVCMVNSPAVIMIPGRVNCPNTYTKQYGGWIMSSHYGHIHPTTFVCLDTNAEPRDGSSAGDENGALLYPTEAEGPPMAGWVHNREISCTVCAANTLKVATFVRWGRTTCSGISNVKELYNGWVGSGNAGHTGSGANYLCMASSPEYAAGYNDGNQDAALIYRTEYEVSGFGVSTLVGLHNHEAACAVCEIPAEKVMMIPGKRTCPNGYTYVYDGYIMSTHYNVVHRGEFLCVDKTAEPIAGSSAGDEGGAGLWPTETESPPGMGYNHDWEVPCVVCFLPVL